VEEVVAVSSGTSGLILVFRCLSLAGAVVLPSFTFMASGHAVLWNGLTPVFADCSIETRNLDPVSAECSMNARTDALLAVHLFGGPADMESLQRVADGHGVPLVVDAAHGFGARYPDGSKVGSKGIAEVFSLSPTKPLSTGEGGLIATCDPAFARELRVAREYGNPGTHAAIILGLNARMTELAAVTGCRALEDLPFWLDRRRQLVERYRSQLGTLPGVVFQKIQEGAESSYKDVSLWIAERVFSLGRDTLIQVLAAENIPTRRYFDPPLHRQPVYSSYAVEGSLPNTEVLSAGCLTLPLYSHMPFEYIDAVSTAISRAYDHREEIAALSAQGGKDRSLGRLRD